MNESEFYDLPMTPRCAVEGFEKKNKFGIRVLGSFGSCCAAVGERESMGRVLTTLVISTINPSIHP